MDFNTNASAKQSNNALETTNHNSASSEINKRVKHNNGSPTEIDVANTVMEWIKYLPILTRQGICKDTLIPYVENLRDTVCNTRCYITYENNCVNIPSRSTEYNFDDCIHICTYANDMHDLYTLAHMVRHIPPIKFALNTSVTTDISLTEFEIQVYTLVSQLLAECRNNNIVGYENSKRELEEREPTITVKELYVMWLRAINELGPIYSNCDRYMIYNVYITDHGMVGNFLEYAYDADKYVKYPGYSSYQQSIIEHIVTLRDYLHRKGYHNYEYSIVNEFNRCIESCKLVVGYEYLDVLAERVKSISIIRNNI